MSILGTIGTGFGGVGDYPAVGQVHAGAAYNFGNLIGTRTDADPSTVEAGVTYGDPANPLTGTYGPVPSPPGQTTGFLTCFNANGTVAAGVEVTIKAYAIDPSTPGEALDMTARTAVSDGAGLVQFPNMFKGLTYQIWRTSTVKYRVKIPTTAGGTYELPSIIG